MRPKIDLAADDVALGETYRGGHGTHHDRPPVCNFPTSVELLGGLRCRIQLRKREFSHDTAVLDLPQEASERLPKLRRRAREQDAPAGL